MTTIYYDKVSKCWMDAWHTVLAGDVPFILVHIQSGHIVAKAITKEDAYRKSQKYGSAVTVLAADDDNGKIHRRTAT
jgi:hypothetical protein